MILAQIKIFKEGVSLGIASEDGKIWGEYSLVGDKADKIISSLFKIIDKTDPIMGNRFKEKRRKRK